MFNPMRAARKSRWPLAGVLAAGRCALSYVTLGPARRDGPGPADP